MNYRGPVAGGPIHAGEFAAHSPVVRAKLVASSSGSGPVAQLPPEKRGGLYRWCAYLRMWVWDGPNTCSKREPM